MDWALVMAFRLRLQGDRLRGQAQNLPTHASLFCRWSALFRLACSHEKYFICQCEFSFFLRSVNQKTVWFRKKQFWCGLLRYRDSWYKKIPRVRHFLFPRLLSFFPFVDVNSNERGNIGNRYFLEGGILSHRIILCFFQTFIKLQKISIYGNRNC